jgi:hypothetical protein
MYTPLPFVGKPLDQSEQQMRLVDLMYQAQLARIQKEQEARLQGANMFMNLGMQLPQILNTVEQNRIRQMQAEADVTRADAYRRYMDAQAELNREQNLLKRQEAAYESVAGGTQIPLDQMAQFGPFGAGFEVTPLQESVSERSVTPQESVSLASLMRPEMDARPVGTLPSRPMGVSVLPGMAVETPTEFGGFATKPKSKEQLAAEEATAKAEAAQASIEALRQRLTPDQQRVFDVAQATSGMNLPGTVMEQLTGVVRPETPQTMAQMEAEDARQWMQANPGKTLTDYRAMVAGRTRAPREERDSTASDLRLAESFRRNYETESKEWRIIAPAYGRVVAAYEEAVKGESSGKLSPAADISLVFAFMKMLDPNSVVREAEYATAENARGVPESIRAVYNKLKDGARLTASQRADFVSQAYAQVQSAANMQRERRGRYELRLNQIPNISQDAFLGNEMFVTTPVPNPFGTGTGGSTGYGARKKP